ncbi:hypothetical protein PR048_031386 [Dryococelus australis]|uniref:Uncharacterized protein n=1 Tax=Dryococelus australis TaxID=614101 RepID=A0ABQ9G970_9NEOP|nr:hypothetical protein PR048_031386 [Dryococelus australis]
MTVPRRISTAVFACTSPTRLVLSGSGEAALCRGRHGRPTSRQSISSCAGHIGSCVVPYACGESRRPRRTNTGGVKRGSNLSWHRREGPPGNELALQGDNGAAAERKVTGSGRCPRKPADQRHRPARFPLTKIREWPGRGLNPVSPWLECLRWTYLRVSFVELYLRVSSGDQQATSINGPATHHDEPVYDPSVVNSPTLGQCCNRPEFWQLASLDVPTRTAGTAQPAAGDISNGPAVYKLFEIYSSSIIKLATYDKETNDFSTDLVYKTRQLMKRSKNVKIYFKPASSADSNNVTGPLCIAAMLHRLLLPGLPDLLHCSLYRERPLLGHNWRTHQVEERREYAEGGERRGGQQDAHGLAAQRAEVEEGRAVVHLVLVLDLPLLVLEVEDGASLRVVQRRRAVERAQDEGEEHDPRHRLQPQPPADRAATPQNKNTHSPLTPTTHLQLPHGINFYLIYAIYQKVTGHLSTMFARWLSAR